MKISQKFYYSLIELGKNAEFYVLFLSFYKLE